ncbi:MAG TPA: hypothetical protein VLK25_07040 [Allosphingosinicella sp.]|nr:hypothetical protein [Allosphingosinicella sp.]
MAALGLAALAACSGATDDAANNAAGANAAVPADVAADFQHYLPAPGTYPARAMRLAVPADYRRLAARMMGAIQRDRAWFETYARQHPGARGPLPWHPRFGMSAADYRRMIALSSEIRLEEVGRLPLGVAAAPGGGLVLSAGGPAARLNGIVLHPERDSVDTPRGRLTRRVAINQNNPDAPTGPWTGVQWSSEGRGPGIRLALGQTARGEGIVYYDVSGADETVVLFFGREP